MSIRTVPSYYSPIGFQRLAVSSIVVSLTVPAAPPVVRAADIVCEANQIRYRFDGGNPSATDGPILDVGDTLQLSNTEQIANFHAIRVGGDAVLQIHYSGGHF